jgi:ppGpp synthetase/RelA/SpoT-type nucleotidyltranferase
VGDGYAALATAYEDERPLYEELARHLSGLLREEMERLALHTTVTGRAKEISSFVTKALLKGYADPLNEIGDKAGVRVTVVYAEDVPIVEEAVRRLLHVVGREQKLDALAYNETGYLGVHLDTRLRDEDVERLNVRLKGLRAEVQIRTMVQSAWAEVSHEQLYKPAAEVPDELKRQIYRLVSVVELFDLEVARFLDEARRTPGYAEAEALRPLGEELLQRFDIRRRADRQLSLTLAASLVPLYGLAPDEVYPQVLADWISANEEALRVQFAEAAALALNPLIHQPEVFIIFERLSNDTRRLEEAWPERLPRAWLVDLAEAWGTPVDE